MNNVPLCDLEHGELLPSAPIQRVRKLKVSGAWGGGLEKLGVSEYGRARKME